MRISIDFLQILEVSRTKIIHFSTSFNFNEMFENIFIPENWKKRLKKNLKILRKHEKIIPVQKHN